MPEPAVEPVLRAFTVLEALNYRPSSGLAALAEATRLPKPTLVRLLDTLIAGGYVERLPRRSGYALTERVVRLSGGFRHTDALVETARPFLSALTAEHRWPVAIATLDRDAMRVRASTRAETPFSTDPDFVNRRVPMLVSALGRAYFALCPDDERAVILRLLRASKSPADLGAREPRYIRSLIEAVRRAGYATTATLADDPAHGIAIPIRSGARLLGAMTLRYMGAALDESEAARRYLPSLRHTAERIAAAVPA